MDNTSFRYQEQEYYHNRQIDTLRLFFEDVANIPIIRGKQDYLPLTRRIRRGELLSSLYSTSIRETFNRLYTELNQEIQEFNSCCKSLGRPQMNVAQLGSQVEDFLDDPAKDIPSALAASLGKRRRSSDPALEQFEDIGWRIFYLLSLTPLQLRQKYSIPYHDCESEFAAHFKLVQDEATASLTRLVEGTLRYVINIAVQYADKGIPYLDLVQEGVEGLRIAGTKYIERKGHFQQYAGAWIRQRITRHIAESRSLIRVPVHMAEKVNILLEQIEAGPVALENDSEILVAIADDEDNPSPLSTEQLRRLLIATARHLSLERTNPNGQTEDGEPLYFEDVLAAEMDVEATIEQSSDTKLLQYFLLQYVPKSGRNWDMIQLRLGLADGEERTLEEVGREYALTRERVRQIEAKVMKRLEAEALNSRSALHIFRDLPKRKGFILSSQPDLMNIYPVYEATFVRSEKSYVQYLIQNYIQRGRTEWNIRGLQGRRALLYQVLSEIGRPTHYSIIHQQTLERIPEGLHFPKKDTYATLFYATHLFRPYGQAVFGLVEWGEEDTTADEGEVVFSYCPMPLLPLQAHPSSFFDSVEYGRHLLCKQPSTANSFWQAMITWAGVEPSAANPQEAFNAWYAVGLIPLVRYVTNGNTHLELTTPPNADLRQMRLHCLNTLCQRVAKMPELLLTLTTIGRATLYNIQRTLFGSKAANRRSLQVRLLTI